jgi:hypothetical protein
MFETGKNQLVAKKAYEISYAVYRVCANVANVALKDHMEREALNLLDAAAIRNYEWALLVSQAIQYLARFGSDAAVLNSQNAETILGELAAFDALIAELQISQKPEPKEVPLDGVFTKTSSRHSPEPMRVRTESESELKPEFEAEVRAAAESRPQQPQELNEAIEAATGNGFISAKIRQSSILERIRQSGNCRLKELQEILPGTSERTLRYDIESLIAQNRIERVGTGGPAIYYRIRQNA